MLEDETIGQKTSVLEEGPHVLNAENLRNFLREAKVEGYGEANSTKMPTIRKFSTGQSNPTYLIDGKFVLRKQPPGVRSNATAHRLDREFKVLQCLEKANFPAPKAIAYCGDEKVLGASFYLMSFVKGRVFSSPALPGMTPAERRATYESVVSTLAKLHTIDWREIGLEDYGQCGNMYGRQISSLSAVSDAQMRVGPGVPVIPLRDELARDMKDYMPDDAVSLVHGDYKFDNILLHEKEPRVVAVLDWELSTIGHPMSDVANLCGMFTTPYNPDATGGGGLFSASHTAFLLTQLGLAGMPDFETSGVMDEAQLLSSYAKIAGVSYPVPDWHFYKAFYWWRGAIIAQGIGARLVAKQASSKEAQGFAAMTPLLAHFAKEEMDLHVASRGGKEKKHVLVKGLKEEDEYCHKVEQAENYNESVYVNFHSRALGVGGFFRMANRANERKGENTFCFYLEDGSVVFSFARNDIKNNNGWSSQTMKYDTVKPFRKIRTRYEGRAYHLTQPFKMSDPKKLFQTDKPRAKRIRFVLDHHAVGPVYGKKAEKDSTDQFAKNHYEQHMLARGFIEIEGEGRREIEGFGLRDHSWGPRYWQSIESYRWVTGNFSKDFGFVISVIGSKAHAFVQVGEDTVLHTENVSLVSKYVDEAAFLRGKLEGDAQWFAGATRPMGSPNKHQLTISATVGNLNADGFELGIEGTVLGFVPLRNVRDGKKTTLGEGFTKYTVRAVAFAGKQFNAHKGQVGYGMSEYLDQEEAHVSAL